MSTQEEKNDFIEIKDDLRPAYYDDFHCLAGDCRFTCCKGWKIAFNKKDYLSLKRQRGSDSLNVRMEKALHRLRNAPDGMYGEFDVSDGGPCPIQREDGLCLLQAEKGHEALPAVCRIFPRYEMKLPSGYLERGLSTACEGVVALLWDHPEGIEFRSDPLPKAEQVRLSFPASSRYTFFGPVREWCVDMLQDRRFSLPQRILMMGAALQELTDEGTDMAAWMLRARALQEGEGAELPDSGQTLALFLSNDLQVLLRVTPPQDFSTLQAEVVSGLGLQIRGGTSQADVPLAPYLNARQRFREQGWDYFMENLAVNLLFHMAVPDLESGEALWKSYVNYCNLYSFFRFLAVMSCREGVEDCRAELTRTVVFASRMLLHGKGNRTALRDEYFKNDSATLAHMAILLAG